MTETLVAPSRRTTAQRVLSTILTSRESAIALVLVLVVADDSLFLQVKEANPSELEPYV